MPTRSVIIFNVANILILSVPLVQIKCPEKKGITLPFSSIQEQRPGILRGLTSPRRPIKPKAEQARLEPAGPLKPLPASPKVS